MALEKKPSICYRYLPMETYAALDIGSNTFRLLIARVDGTVRPLLIRRVITRLGGGVSLTGRITPEAETRALDCLKRFSQDMLEHEVRAYRATATAALRNAVNAQEFVIRAESECSIVVEIISGDEEARLTLAGVLGSLTERKGKKLVFDVGGGSTEFILCEDGRLVHAKSIGLGVVDLTEQFFLESDPPSIEARERLTTFTKKRLSDLVSDIVYEAEGVNDLVGTAGTVTTLAAMMQNMEEYDPLRINNYVIHKYDLQSLYARLLALPLKDRVKLPGLEPGRADVIVAGAMLVLEAMEIFNVDQVRAIDAGLLEGTFYSLIPSFSS
jgi:exopolyphosphatase/guanosine-5'-triphosphate,3'-diphosphate pyrophosphatase